MTNTEDVTNTTEDVNISTEEKLQTLTLIPNEAIYSFFSEKIINIIKESQAVLISSLVSDNKEENPHLSNIVNIIHDMENNKWKKLPNELILPDILSLLKAINDIEYEELTKKVHQYIQVEDKITKTDPDNLFNLYKYIETDDEKSKIIEELYQLSETMF